MTHYENVDFMRLSSIFNLLPHALILLQPISEHGETRADFVVIYTNNPAAAIFNYTPDALVGSRVLRDRMLFEGDTEAFTKRCRTVLDGKQPVRYTAGAHYGRLQLEVLLQPFEDGVLCTLTDTTEVKQLEEALKKESELNASVFNASVNGIFVLEAVRNSEGDIQDFRIVKVNSTFARIIGKKEEALIGASYLSVLAPSRENGLFELKKTILATGVPVQKEIYYKGAGIDGWFHISMAPVGTEGIVETFADITANKRDKEEVEDAAQRLATVVNTSKAGMFTLYPVFSDGVITDFRFGIVNEAVAAYIGQTAEVLAGSLGSVYFPAYKTNGLFNIYRETYLSGQAANFDFHYEDGYDVFFNIDVVKMGDEVLVTFTDHTAYKRLQRELERSVAELKQLNTNLEDFAYAASHDLKEPVRKIRFFSERLLAMMGDRMAPEEKSMMQRVENATNRMGLLIDDLLEYSHVSRGDDKFELVDLSRKVALVLDDLEVTVQEKGAQIKVGPLPTVKGHRRQLQQLFQNLLTNSLKYSKPGVAPVVTISSGMLKGREAEMVRPADADKSFHHIEVKDNGIGFEQEDAIRIFKVFTRLHGKSEYSGTGIGLSIVKKVVDNHDGYIWANSEPGQGATFHLLLPQHTG